MSAGNGHQPPVPPEAQGPQVQQIPILKEISWQSQQTTAARTDDGGGIVSFIVVENGQPVRHTYAIGEPGKKLILEEFSGGLQLP